MNSPAVYSLIPLPEIISELLGVGSGSKKVMRVYSELITRFSSEFNLLLNVEIEDIKDHGVLLLDEAVQKMRAGKVFRNPGYDGEFRRIRLFN